MYLNQSQKLTLVSQQLKLLKNARILTNEKIGKTVTYSIYDRHILHLLKDVAEHLDEQEGGNHEP